MKTRSMTFPIIPLLDEILMLLPVKCLGQCRCVCKKWRSLISRPDFCKARLSRSISMDTQKLLILSTVRGDYGRIYSIQKTNEQWAAVRLNLNATRLWGSCRGLILIGDQELANPTTCYSRKLKKASQGDYNRVFKAYGIGYDTILDDYVVVAISYYQHSTHHKDSFFYVFALKTSKWERVLLSPYDHRMSRDYAGVLFQGGLHWFAKSGDLLVLIAFNVSGRSLASLPKPENLTFEDGTFSFPEIGVLDDCLSVVAIKGGQETFIWLMRSYGVAETWVTLVIQHPVSQISALSIREESWNVICVEEGKFLRLIVTQDGGVRIQDFAVHGLPEDFEVGLLADYSLISPFQ